ncbi:MAG: PAS domain-containing protein [Deltaproteobacteria bacterium]|nr:PAS domain-containing protein [Deltaproteobacteria bacterium]MBW2019393.1 PAS domain-containing protein [Deltaproteobacteria bacterium]MBW2074230.1 PAS domain-containing protein [Deltaproteobacteria bacterium]
MAKISEQEARRRKRERIIMVALVLVVGLLTYAETKVVRFGAGLPISNTVVMFILININMLVLLLLIFLVFRNIVKLLYDRKRKVMGAKLRTKLAVAFVSLSLIPTILLFFFSIQFITSSVAFWFNVPVEHSLERSLEVGKYVYKHITARNRFYLERIAYQIVRRNLLNEENRKALAHYIQVAQRAFDIDAIEVYSTRSERLAVALDADIEGTPFSAVSADAIQKELHEVNFSTLTGHLPSGEMIKTLGCIPSNAAPDEAIGVVAVTTVIPASLSEDMAAISRGFDQYQQIKMMKRPIQVSHLITLSIVALLIIFCATWFGFHLAKTLTIPIQELAEGTRRVAEGDLNFTIDRGTDDEIGTLVNAFNKMTRDLRAGKQQLELSARELRERNLEIEQKRLYMETVLKNVSTGVISIDATGFISTINKSAEKMLGIKGEQVLNRSYKKVLSSEHLALARDLLEELENSLGNLVERPVRINIDQRARTFMVHVTALKDDKDRYMGTVVVFDDLTEIEKAQRMAAWREVARRIAHEVKNPLTPIKLSAQRLRRKYGDQIVGDNSVFMECTQTIIDQVDQIRNLVNEFSAFARLPAADPEPCHLAEIIEDTVALYREAQPHLLFEINSEPDIPQLNLDRQQMKRVMINLIDNAIAAMNGKGTIGVAISFDSILKIVRLEVSDTGPGISPEDKVRLFEPYFSTKKTGMGLGLSIVSTIIADHNGFIRVQDNQPRGTKFIVELPA